MKLFFPDNTVLVNFAIIGRMDLLEKVLNGKGRWCATVMSECVRAATNLQLPDLLGAAHVLGEPIYPQQAEHVQARAVRIDLARPGDHPNQHLGEAETIAVIGSRFFQSFFVTDDGDAMRVAKAHEIPVLSTWHLFKHMVKRQYVTCHEMLDYLAQLRHRGAPKLTGCSDLDNWAAS